MPAAIFSIDATLLDARVAEDFHDYMIERGLMPRAGAAKVRLSRALVRLLGGRAVAGFDPTALLRHFAVNAYRGVDTNDLRREARKCFKERFQARVFREAREVVARHVEACDEVVFAGPAGDFLISEFVSELGAHTGIGIRPNLFGTRIHSYFDPIPHGAEKLRAVREALDRLDLGIEEATAYASDESDLPLLEAVGKAVAVNPTAKLEEAAKARGWEVARWSGRSAA